MKRKIAAALATVAVVAGVGWKLTRHAESTAGLEEIKLVPGSEHSQPGPGGALAGIRIRLSPTDFDGQLKATAHKVPQIAVAGE